MGAPFDIVVIGGGIVGLATARALLGAHRLRLVVIEAETDIARHQTGHNSGVIHSGLYYAPGSLKARLCAEGREALYRYCASRDIAHARCGKVVVATRPHEVEALEFLETRGRTNGLAGIRMLDRAALREIEPHVDGLAALHVPETGIVDFAAVARALAADVRTRGGEIRTSSGFRRLSPRRDGWRVVATGEPIEAGLLINCAGLHADRVARRCGMTPTVRLVPFRGEYRAIRPERRHLVRHLVYPVPDPRYPFLGVHFTRTIHDEVTIGPTAVLATARHGYRRRDVSVRDLVEMLAWPGFLRFARRHTGAAWREARRALDPRVFQRELQRLVPELRPGDHVPGGSGVRAQAVARDGTLVDDFVIEERPGMLHVLNAPSPAATASLAIGRYVAERASGHLEGRRVTTFG